MVFIPDNVDKTKVFGCDVSFYQNEPTTPHGIDFHKMRAEGASFAIIRAGQNLWADPQFKTSWADARKSGLLVGSYWYLDVRASLRGQAKLYADMVRDDMGDLPLTIDFEQAAQKDPITKKITQLRITHLEAFLIYLKEYLPNMRTPIIYTGFYFWRDFGSKDEKWDKYPLWIAGYKMSKPSIPAPWKDYTFWQWTESGAGKLLGVESNAVDVNYFNGTIDDLVDFAGAELSPIEIPTIEETMIYKYEATPLYASGMSVRSAPNTNNLSVGTLPYGKIAKGNLLAGDGVIESWLKIEELDGVPVTGEKYVAIIHTSKVYCKLTVTDAPPVEPPPSSGDPVQIAITAPADVALTVLVNGVEYKRA